jgi:peptide deformylase
MIRDLVIYPDHRLVTPCKPVKFFDESLNDLVEDLFNTMYAHDGLGLAAPQIGELQSVFVMDVRDGKKPHNPLSFINPELLVMTVAELDEEGCLSMPGLFLQVRRATFIHYAAYTLDGQRHVGSLRDMEARVFQHEVDHLDGRLFIERASVEALAAAGGRK